MATRVALPGALAGVVLGVLAADANRTGAAFVAAICIGALTGLLTRLGRPSLVIGCAALAVGVALGAWRGTALALPSGPGSLASLVGRGELRIVGAVVDDPRPRGSTQQVVLEDLIVSRPAGGRTRVAGKLMATLPRSIPLAVGNRVAFVAAIEAPAAFDGFDYPAYLARLGIGGLVRVRQASVVDELSPNAPSAVTASLRRWLLDGLNEMVPEPEAALGAGILLGVRTSIAPEVANAFAIAGLTHVVAISGWNIAIVAAIVGSLFRPLERRRGGRWLAPLGAGMAIGGYVLLTGASPSVVRAALMAGAMMVARLGGSRAHAASALGAAALAMLIAAPSVLWDVGFQLSGLATAGLIMFGASIEGRLAGWPAWLREPVALTLAAQLTTLPVVLGSFGRLSLIAPLANVLVVPLVPMVMLLCAIAAPLGALVASLQMPLLGDAARWAVGGFAWLLLRSMIVIGQAAASIPYAALPVTAPGWLALAWYPGLAIGWKRMADRAGREPAADAHAGLRRLSVAHRRPSAVARIGELLRTIARPAVGIAAVALLLAVLTVATRADGRMHMVALDVGQGDAILVTAPSGAVMLIDGGPDPDLLLRRLGEWLPWWQRHIDVMILTHPHEDHVAGLVAALERYRVSLILDTGRDYANPTYPRFLRLAHDEPGARFVAARAGQRIRLDGVTTLTLLYPTAADVSAPLPEGDINNASAVGLLRSGAFTALLTGDAHAPVEAILAARGLLPRVDVLKVGHHGSRSSGSPVLLHTTHPGAALICVGIGNRYGHPHQETLDHLGAIPGLRLHRTDLDGSIEVISDGARYQVRSRTVTDPWRAVVGASLSTGRPAGTIGAWPSPRSPWPSSCSPPSTCPMGSSPTLAASAASRPRRPGSFPPPRSRSIRSSSRSPPCCTTLTSRRRVAMGAHTAWSAPAGWPSADSRSCRSRSPRTR